MSLVALEQAVGGADALCALYRAITPATARAVNRIAAIAGEDEPPPATCIAIALEEGASVDGILLLCHGVECETDDPEVIAIAAICNAQDEIDDALEGETTWSNDERGPVTPLPTDGDASPGPRGATVAPQTRGAVMRTIEDRADEILAREPDYEARALAQMLADAKTDPTLADQHRRALYARHGLEVRTGWPDGTSEDEGLIRYLIVPAKEAARLLVAEDLENELDPRAIAREHQVDGKAS